MTLSAFDRLAQVRRHAALGQLVLGAPMPVAFAGVVGRFASSAIVGAIVELIADPFGGPIRVRVLTDAVG